MADYNVIADIGQTLVKLLREQLAAIVQPELINLASPTDKGDLALTLFLYDVRMDVVQQQNSMIARGGGKLQYPPLPLELRYLLTTHSTSELTSRAVDEQRLLGRALQVLHDHSTLRGALLQGSLSGSPEEFRVVLTEHLHLQAITSMFSDKPYKLSFGFAVTPLYLESGRTRQTTPVRERSHQFKQRSERE